MDIEDPLQSEVYARVGRGNSKIDLVLVTTPY